MIPQWHNSWAGHRVALIGSGPSLVRDDVDRLRQAGYRLIGCNDNHVFDPHLLYVADYDWLRNNPCDAPLRFTCEPRIARDYGWTLVDIKSGVGLSTVPGILHSGGFSGFQMLNLAVQLGASQIVLTGYDCQATDGLKRWRGDHPPDVEKGQPTKFSQWVDAFRSVIAPVVNCSRKTAIDAFPVRSLEEVLC